MNLLIISHTEHYLEKGEIVGWGPTVNEINQLATLFEKVYHIAPLHQKKTPKSSLPYVKNIQFIPIQPSGGKGLKKISILFTSFNTLGVIYKYLSRADIVHFRAPTGIGVVVLPFLRLFFKRKVWVKYAGNWKDLNMPLGNRLQKRWLQNCVRETDVVTVNGKWAGEKKNIIPFENPTLTQSDRKEGEESVLSKHLNDKVNFCFVGALNTHKGVPLIIDALTDLSKEKNFGTFHFVGSGKEETVYRDLVQNIGSEKIIFHGFLPKHKITKVYKNSHFILLPSKSEGFPKVVSEGMNYGCIPIVSDVSAINQYVNHLGNGYLLHSLTVEDIIQSMKWACTISSQVYRETIEYNYQEASVFTYELYLNKVKELLNLNG